MATARRSRKSAKGQRFLVTHPLGRINHRVQAVGPEHFGIVSVDCAKVRSKLLLCDFYGNVLIEPTYFPHTQADFDAAIERLRRAMTEHQLRDLVVAIERTGTYHQLPYHAFRRASFDTRLVHPLTTRYYRQPANPDNKTDDTDLIAIFQATVNGFGLLEPDWTDDYQQLQILTRQRRELVQKNTILRCQIREVLHLLMPGYAEAFSTHFFDTPAPLHLARATGSAQAVLTAGLNGLRACIPDTIPYRSNTLLKVLAWARNAPASHPQNQLLRASLDRLDDDRKAKTQQISALEQQSARVLAGTPYVLFLALPGINVVSSAELAGELGPIAHYANANRITGRAGLVPSRYQSDQVDRANGPLRRRGHRRLRAALLQIADCLLTHNHHYQSLAERWRRLGKDPRWIHVKIAKAFSRLAFVVLTGRCLVGHPACQPRSAIFDKLLAFHHEHRTDIRLVLDDFDRIYDQLPQRTRSDETENLQRQLDDPSARRRHGPVGLAQIIPQVLARLGVRALQSTTEGQDLS